MTVLNNFNEALNIIKESEMNAGKSIVISIDGRCASGKTTFAGFLQSNLDCNVIHLDDFFLQPHQRTPERLAIPGGNFDIERFKEEVISGLLSGEDFCYRPFDCKKMSFSAPVFIKQKRITIIEGSYSHHPKIAAFSDLKFFLTVTEEQQKERLLVRNKEKADMFFSKWIPLEEKYFSAFSIAEKSDYVIKT